MPHRSDEALFAAFQDQRDCQALGELFHRRADELLRLAVFLAPRPSDAEDLVQATFLSAIARAETFHAGNRVMSWLCGILTNHARMLRRAERRSAPAAPVLAVEDPADAALHSELRQALTNGIAGLPEPYRSVLSLHLEAGLDSAEISARLERPAATVRKQMERALDRLRAALPIGLAAAFASRLDAKTLAANAADAARFVEAEPLSTTAAQLAAPLSRLGWWSFAAVLLLVAAFAPWSFTPSASPPAAPADATATAPAVVALPQEVPPAPTLDAAADVARRRTDATADLEVRAQHHDAAPARDLELLLVGDTGKALPERILSGKARAMRTDRNGVAVWKAVPAGDYDVAFAGAISKHKVTLVAGTHTITLELPPPIAFAGVVVDQDGHPVAEAEIVVSETSLRGDLGAVVARTRVDGSFAASAPLSNGRVFAQHDRFRTSVGTRLEAATALRLVLQPLRRDLEVTVRDAKGHAVRGAYVAVVPRSSGLSLLPPQHARSDDTGRCHFRDPGNGEASVIASHDGLSPATADLAPNTAAITLILLPGTRLHGTLRDAAGAALPDTQVLLACSDQRSNEPVAPLLARAVRTDAHGSFVVQQVPLGSVQVQVFGEVPTARGLLPFPWLLAATDVDVVAGENPPIDLRAASSQAVRGRLLDAAGLPVAQYNVIAVPTQGTAIHRAFRTRGASTDPEGNFVVLGLAPDEDYELGAFLPDGPRQREAAFPVASGRARPGAPPVTLQLSPRLPTCRLHVRVLGPDGRPHPGASLELRSLAVQWPHGKSAAADGSAAFGPLSAGDYWLAVVAPGLGTRVLPVQVENDQSDLDLGLVTLQSPARLQVLVCDDVGKVMPGVRLIARGRVGDKFVGATTNTYGLATLAALPPGEVDVLAVGPGIAPRSTRTLLHAGEQRLELAVQHAATVPLQFTFALADNPFVVNGPLHVRVQAIDGSLDFEENLGAVTARGRFECATGLPPGRYRVVARALWNASAHGEFDVPAGREVAPQHLVLRR